MKNHKWQSYDVWFLRYGAWQTELFITLGRFLPFYHPNNLKNQNFEKMKKSSRDIIILHKCTINDNYMMYGSWDMKCDRYNFLSFWTFLCPFTPLTIWKTGKKKPVDIISFIQVNQKLWSYAILFLRYGKQWM